MNVTHRQRLMHIRSIIDDLYSEATCIAEEKTDYIEEHETRWIQTDDGLREIREIAQIHSTVACLLEASGTILRIITTK